MYTHPHRFGAYIQISTYPHFYTKNERENLLFKEYACTITNAHTHTHTYTCTPTYIHPHTNILLHVNLNTYKHTRVYMCTNTNTCAHIYTHKCMHSNSHKNPCKYSLIYNHIHHLYVDTHTLLHMHALTLLDIYTVQTNKYTYLFTLALMHI